MVFFVKLFAFFVFKVCFYYKELKDNHKIHKDETIFIVFFVKTCMFLSV
jgi:hypothetical protein